MNRAVAPQTQLLVFEVVFSTLYADVKELSGLLEPGQLLVRTFWSQIQQLKIRVFCDNGPDRIRTCDPALIKRML